MHRTTTEVTTLSGTTYRTRQDIEQKRNEGSLQRMNRVFDMLCAHAGVARG
ncbi:MAG: hypothetical protein U1D29_01055 [Burkholderiales bacterium]|nr:hypothetical protein [Burkholderiales bacterium]